MTLIMKKDQEKNHYTYIITNLINGKIYYGVRSCTCHPENDIKYMGSGLLIKYAIEKYGKENFSKEIDQTFPSREEANLFEAKIVDMNFIERNDTYNMMTGGLNGLLTEDSKCKISLSKLGKKRSPETCKNISKAKKGTHVGENNPNYGVKCTDEKKMKISKGRKGKQAGSEHYNYGQPLNPKILSQIVQNWELIAPNGDKYMITNLAQFCREYNLSNSKLSLVASGQRNHHKGWKCKRLT